jgi:hypothetical protein
MPRFKARLYRDFWSTLMMNSRTSGSCVRGKKGKDDTECEGTKLAFRAFLEAGTNCANQFPMIHTQIFTREIVSVSGEEKFIQIARRLTRCGRARQELRTEIFSSDLLFAHQG